MLQDKTEHDYWEYRASLSYTYKGETFYTVTPIPYYYRRRAVLLTLMDPLLQKPNTADICDFGCGDGWYIQYFAHHFSGKHWCGIDSSTAMIELAKRICPFAKLQVSREGITFKNSFDLVYAFAVFAHIPDHEIPPLFANIYQKLRPRGYFVFFESTGPSRLDGKTWHRRTNKEYNRFAAQHGFEVKNRHLISYPLHRFFEKRVAPYFYRLFVGKGSHIERCIYANRSWFFRLLSTMMLSTTRKPIRDDVGKYEGNTLYITQKLTNV